MLVVRSDYLEMDYVVNDVEELQLKCLKTIIHVPTMYTGSEICHYLHVKLSNAGNVIERHKIGRVLLFHGIWDNTLKYIQTELAAMDSKIKVLTATFAYGIGVNVQ